MPLVYSCRGGHSTIRLQGGIEARKKEFWDSGGAVTNWCALVSYAGSSSPTHVLSLTGLLENSVLHVSEDGYSIRGGLSRTSAPHSAGNARHFEVSTCKFYSYR